MFAVKNYTYIFNNKVSAPVYTANQVVFGNGVAGGTTSSSFLWNNTTKVFQVGDLANAINGNKLIVSDAGNLITIGSPLNHVYLSMDTSKNVQNGKLIFFAGNSSDTPLLQLITPGEIFLGDKSGTNKETNIYGGTDIFLKLDGVHGQVDLNAGGTHDFRLQLDDTHDVFFLGTESTFHGLNFFGAASTGYTPGSYQGLIVDDKDDRILAVMGSIAYLTLDHGGSVYRLGNPSLTHIDLFGSDFAMTVNNNLTMDMDEVHHQYRFGDLGGSQNGCRFLIDDSAKSMNHIIAGHNYLTLDVTNGFFKMGDMEAAANGTYLHVDDVNKVFTLSNSQAGVLSPFNVPNIPTYANRTAALAGGLIVGDHYQLPIAADNQVICVV